MRKGLILLIAMLSFNCFAKEVVLIGVYHFPPYLELKGAEYTGISKTIVNILNEVQDKFEFKLFITTPNRRYQDFKHKKFQMMLFEDIAWGWKDRKLDRLLNQSSIIMKGGEVFITINDGKRNQSYFKDLKGKSIMGILGYHYKFADFISDPPSLKLNYNTTVVSNQENIINAVLSKRFEVGIITKEYLIQYLRQYPERSKNLLISNFYDQTYEHRLLFRKDIKNITPEYIESLIKKLKSHEQFIGLHKSIKK
ncbi:MAG: ABC-type amino acid transport substrate-binding protein [Bacteriovoracaceae bacterium]|jgi:polar amino acid transport system substrate-binding protein